MFDEEFFPTPKEIATLMLNKIDRDARYFLEPSAGKGDLTDAIEDHSRYGRLEIDVIESNPDLLKILSEKDLSVVGNDWLTYDGVSYYDAIVMNPPFSNGDEHLLKAWDFLHAGEIVCLLNEETILNPYSAKRERLKRIIDEHGNVEYLGSCFSTAERKTDVRVALVYLKKVEENDADLLWAKETDEKEINSAIQSGNMLAVQDKLGNMQHFYDEANLHMFKAFEHIRKAASYMGANGISPMNSDMDKILSLAYKNMNSAKAEFIRFHRNKSWHEVFGKMEFHKWLDKKQREEFIRDINRNGKIPFTKENIKGTLQNIYFARGQLFEKSVANVFDTLTRYYSGNTSHEEGWKSNDNYKVNMKIVFPYGCVFDKKYGRQFSFSYGYSDIDIYNDLDRVLCVLAGKEFEHCYTIRQALQNKFDELGRDVEQGFDNTTESDFFDIKIYMKGTIHLFFKDKDIWARFNQTASKGKMWLGKET